MTRWLVSFALLLSAGAAPAATTVLTGTFGGIEQGDYFYLQLRTDDGTDESLMILQTDASLDALVEDAEALKGTRLRVTVEDRTEDIPEAGGPTQVRVALSVERLPAASHCTADESVVFACAAGRKLVSVCASKVLTATTGHVRYRYGPAGAPEIEWPEPSDATRNQLAGGTLMFSGGGGAYLRFVRADHDYVVYTAIGKGWGEKSGVAVERMGARVANPRCTGPVASELGPDFLERAGIVEDDQGFELPD